MPTARGVNARLSRGKLPGGDGLVERAARSAARGPGERGVAGCGSCFTGGCRRGLADPVTSRARQREQAGALVRGHGRVVAEFFDGGEPDGGVGPPPGSRCLVAQLADPGRGWDAIVVGEYERAFYGSQYAAMAPLFEHYGSSCGCRRRAAGRLCVRA